ncbi:MAG: prenyltransferase [Eggerthellaceae bacterium]|nr:prenyltransferase [Eggerthellaceae bacterium]
MRKAAKQGYSPFRPKHVLQLAAPHTWAASVMPVLFSCVLVVSEQGSVSCLISIALLAISVLMQSSVNTFNDYFDFIRGLDTASDALESDDSTLAYDNVNPRCALIAAIAFLVMAFVIGIPIIVICGWIPLLIAIIGAAIVVLYSAGPHSISSLPLGEAVSGLVMGGLIPLACIFCLTGELDFFVLVLSLPFIIGIGLIMFTNNACDADKDDGAGKRTIAVILGHVRTKKAYAASVALMVIIICVLIAICFQDALMMIPFILLASWPLMKGLLKNPLMPESRIAAMGQVISLNVCMGALYCMCIVF